MRKYEEVPNRLTMTPVAFLDGAKGWAQQIIKNKQYKITVSSERETLDHKFVTVISHPLGAFSNRTDLNAAIRKHNGED